MIRAFFASLLLGAQALASAQEPPKELPASPQASTPVVDPAHALSGRALVEALRGGGYVLLMRHAQQVRYTPECKPEEPNLGPAGQAQARLVAAGLRNLRIPVGSVQASMFCRAFLKYASSSSQYCASLRTLSSSCRLKMIAARCA